MSDDSIFNDKLGIIHAWAAHMAAGNCIDEVPDERVFAGELNSIAGKMQIVIDENFGGDANTFHTQLLQHILVATVAGEDLVSAIDRWLDQSWIESGRLYH